MSGDPLFLDVVQRSVAVAATATALVAVPGIPLAYLLARRTFPGKAAVSTLVGLPLVLPPTAVGYLLLSMLGADGPLGGLGIGWGLILSWKGAVLAAAVMATPLFVRTARVAFEGVDAEYERMALTLGIGPIRAFFTQTLPLAQRGLLAAAILAFTRAIGEFGATVMVAGNIPGRTQTLASALFTAQQTGDAGSARLLLLLALAVGICAILSSELLIARSGREAPHRS